ncbi:DUF4226 domain-containing protein [Nocardia sp. NPDC127579]|uniref:DUF4226 domain-containing protein n=1 Tax=Nocardia sp. NPDC127579 TaxID=3345402 RepID=UPI0036444840
MTSPQLSQDTGESGLELLGDAAGEENSPLPGPVTPWSGGRRGAGGANPAGASGPNGQGDDAAGLPIVSASHLVDTERNGLEAAAFTQQALDTNPAATQSLPTTEPVAPLDAPTSSEAVDAGVPESATVPSEDDGSPIDPGALTELVPTLVSTVLPMLSSALSGLAGGGSGDETAAEVAASGMTPESQRALDALKLLAEVYGDGASTDPEVVALREELGLTDAGTGDGAEAIEARQRWQTYAPKAFNNLDAQLDRYINTLAGSTGVDRQAVANLLRETNVALAELGAEVYTKAGQQQVREILTQALTEAHAIVGGSAAANSDAAAAIDNLTNQWIANIAGKEYASPVSGNMPGGTVGQWIQQALAVLQQNGYDISTIDPEAIAIIIQHESSGDPNAINNWDSNAAKGIPSQGLMQTIPPTFKEWKIDGYENILDPVDNIIAGVRYAIDRYGSVSNVPGVVAVRNGEEYRWY